MSRYSSIVIHCLPSLSGHFLVPPLKNRPAFRPNFSTASVPLLVIPPIRAQHSANVEEDVPDFRHAISTARAGAPSQPSIRSGRQMN